MDNVKCGHTAALRYTWPGRDEAYACNCCAVRIKRVADAMGFHLQLCAVPNPKPCQCVRPPDASR